MKFKRRLNRYLPEPAKIKEIRYLRVFGNRLYQNNLWRINRRAVAGAFAVGLFMAWIPVPFQMFLAAGVALLIGVNLPISVALVWLSNPITMPPLFYFAYRVGAKVLKQGDVSLPFHLKAEWFLHSLQQIGPAFLLGCLLCAITSSLVGYFGVRGLWRYLVVRSWQRRLHY